MSNYSLTGANGDVITFDNSNYVLNPSLVGFGIPPTSVRIDDSARFGGVYRYSRKGVRNIDMPVTVVGVDAVDVENKLRRLSRLVQDDAGPTTLTAVRTAGDLTMELHYTGGAELEYGDEAGGDQWATLLLSFQAPQPYWQSATSQTFSITSGDTGRGLLPQLTKLKVSSSETLGQVNVNNTGDVPVYPVWTVRGPIDNFEARSNSLSFGFSVAIDANTTITIDTEAGTVTDATGANRYDLLLPAPKFFPFLPGNSVIEILGDSTTANTLIIAQYNQRYEVVHG